MRRSGLWWVGFLLVAVSSTFLAYYLCQLPADSITTSTKYHGPTTLTGTSKFLHIAVNFAVGAAIAFVGFDVMRRAKTPPQE